MKGYKIPVLSVNGECHLVSGTSIAAPLFAGLVVLMKQKEGVTSPGALRCRLHGSCVFPKEVQIPTSDYPYFGSAMCFYLVSFTLVRRRAQCSMYL